MRLSPQTLWAVAAAVAVACAGGALHLAASAPVLGLRLAAQEGGGLGVGEVAPGAVLSAPLAPGTRLRAAGGVPLDADLLRDEPDQLGSWERFNDFMARHTALAAALEAGPLVLELEGGETEDGRTVRVTARPRGVGALPFLFWYQVAVGVAGFLIACGVLAFRPADAAARHFALSGLGLLLFCTAASVYSTREFLFAGERLLVLSMLNQFGAMLFTAALVALLGCYPRRLAGPWPLLAYGALTGLTVLYVGQWVPDMGWGYVGVLALFCTTFVLAFVQWWGARPVERAALRWFLLSIYLGTGLFAGAVLLPVALGGTPPVSQGVMFVVFLFMFVGIALGILRYRLFDLDRWWLQAWSWFFGGLAVILFDFVLAAVLGVSHEGALGLALAVSGWVYFPLRQAVWSRWRRQAVRDRGERVGQWMLALFSARGEQPLRARWEALLRAEFAPLEWSPGPATGAGVQVSEDGQSLRVPVPGGTGANQAITLRHPAGGSRLFRGEDVADAEVLAGMGRRALEAQHAREQGALAERSRLQRDLHDDLGAKLLSLVYLARESETEELARSALRDMRDVLESLEVAPCPLSEALGGWWAEARGRADALGFQLEWTQEGDLPAEQLLLGAHPRADLGRILREALTNALKHARARHVEVRVRWGAGRLRLSVEDDGAAGPSDPAAWRSGTGTRAIRQRATGLGGSVRWEPGARGCRLELEVPLGVPPALEGDPFRG